MPIKIEKTKCPANHKCPSVSFCPAGALRQKGNSVPEINNKLCTDCERCIRFCPYGVFKTGGVQ